MFLYRILSTIIFFVILPFYAIVRALKGKMYGWPEKMGFFETPSLKKRVIVFHGVSVGEVIALENLIKQAKECFPECSIVVTTGTKTGQEIAQKKYSNIADFVTYFPFDIPVFIRIFLKKIKPSIVLIAETEIWPNFANLCYKYSVPLYIINGRISDSTFNLYKHLKLFFKHIFANYTEILTQSEDDKKKFIASGADESKVRVMKNLKFDVKRAEADIQIGQENSRVIIAGSTHHEENEIVLNTFKNLKSEFPDIKLLIAPRHTQRVPQVQAISKSLNLKYGMRSENKTFADNDVIILDTMGELGKMYSVCDLAFIGGSFNKTGGHNPLEAVVYSKPVVSGPDIHNFRDIYGLLGKTKAGKVVKNPKEFEQYMRKLLSDKEFYKQACEDCVSVFNDQQGALKVVIDTLKRVL